jgi:hypothetical protein
MIVDRRFRGAYCLHHQADDHQDLSEIPQVVRYWVQRALFWQLVSSHPFMSQHPQKLDTVAFSQYH